MSSKQAQLANRGTESKGIGVAPLSRALWHGQAYGPRMGWDACPDKGSLLTETHHSQEDETKAKEY